MIVRSSFGPVVASSRPSMPSMRGIEKPQMSASMTPTAKPRSARAAARLAVTDDFPTPPLPEATASTRAPGGTRLGPAVDWACLRATSMAAAFCSASISTQSIEAEVTPGRPSMRVRISRFSWAFSGQPAVVRATTTTAAPASETVADRAMPSSTMSAPSSGSTTPRSAARISSLVGRASIREIYRRGGGSPRPDV